jgi:hypothetical protein
MSLMQVSDAGGLLVTVPSALDAESAARLVSHLESYARQVFVYGRSWDVVTRACVISQECMLAHLFATDFWIAKSVEGGRRVSSGEGRERGESAILCAHFHPL